MAATVVVVLFLLLSFSVFAVSCNDSVLRLSKNNFDCNDISIALIHTELFLNYLVASIL